MKDLHTHMLSNIGVVWSAKCLTMSLGSVNVVGVSSLNIVSMTK